MENRPGLLERWSVDTWLDAVAAGYGVGVTSEATAYHHGRSVVSFRQITDRPQVPVRLVWRRDQEPTGMNRLVKEVTKLYE